MYEALWEPIYGAGLGKGGVHSRGVREAFREDDLNQSSEKWLDIHLGGQGEEGILGGGRWQERAQRQEEAWNRHGVGITEEERVAVMEMGKVRECKF